MTWNLNVYFNVVHYAGKMIKVMMVIPKISKVNKITFLYIKCKCKYSSFLFPEQKEYKWFVFILLSPEIININKVDLFFNLNNISNLIYKKLFVGN